MTDSQAAPPTEGARRRLRARRLAIGGLGVLGVLDSLYMLAYHGGLIHSLACPFFGKGCETVGRSEHARHLGIPNAAVGAVAYAGMAALAFWAGDRLPGERRLPPVLLALVSGTAAAASAVLTWEQKAKVRAWCFWCLTSAGLNAAILPLAAGDGLAAYRAPRGEENGR